MQFSIEEQERYQRHFSLSQVGIHGQIKLKSAQLLIVGAGGLGSPIALYLAAAGVGKITIIDDDIVSLSNLQRQILFSTLDIGRSKALVARERLELLNPNVKINALDKRFLKDNASELVRSHDFVIDGTDNFETRYLVNDTCVANGKSFIFGAVGRFDAQVSVFHFNDGPCYRCLYPKAPPLEAVSNCNEGGVLGVLPGTVGTLMANEALKLILGVGEVSSGTLLVYDSLRSEFQKRKFSRNLACTACGVNPILEKDQSHFFPQLNLDQIQLSKDLFIVDVRQEAEFLEKHLPSAVNIALPDLKSEISKIPRDKSILLVCKSGKRSQRAAEILSDFGFENLFQLQGGMSEIGDLSGLNL